MEKILAYISKNIISILGITILTGTTLTTSALGVMKVANNFEKVNVEVPEVKDKESEAALLLSPTPEANGTTGNANTVTSHPIGNTNKMTGKTVPTTAPTSTNSTNQSISASNTCIVTLFGKQYDVSRLRSTHSGGNIFNCGTDMTAVYQGRHGTDMGRMQQYLITSGGTTSSNASTGSTGTSGSNTSGTTGTSSNQGGVEIKREEEREEESRTEDEHRDEDHEEEEKEHLESLVGNILRLSVS